MELKAYNISPTLGFLPENPVQPLPDYFSEWEAVAQSLPELLRDKCVLEAIEKLPEIIFNDKTLSTQEEWQRAYSMLSFIAQTYFVENGNKSGSASVVKLPSKIAIPWHTTAEFIGVPPAATYAAVVLYNYSQKDPTGAIIAENLDSALKFTRSDEESWFFMIHVEEEMLASSGLEAIVKSYQAMDSDNKDELGQHLATIAKAILKMKSTLARMYVHCSPDFFYNELRPYLGFPESGVIYEGISSDVKKYRSGSGAQDTAIPAFSKFLGIEPSPEEQKTLDDFENYMPAKHREFLQFLKKQPSVKLFVHESKDAQLIQCYEQAVKALKEFRSQHIQLVTRYIVNARSSSSAERTETLEELTGTGGTVFMKFLKNVRDNTYTAPEKK